MEQQQEIVYQLDLFTEHNTEDIHLSKLGKSVSQAHTRKVCQVEKAGQQERALTESLMQWNVYL